MLQQHEPDDYVLATGEMHFMEVGYERKSRRELVKVGPRPIEVDQLLGDASKAVAKLAGSQDEDSRTRIRNGVQRSCQIDQDVGCKDWMASRVLPNVGGNERVDMRESYLLEGNVISSI